MMSMENGDHNLSLDFSSETNSIIPEIDIHNPLMFISGAELLFVPVIQLSNLDSIILPPNSPIYEQTVDISASPSVDPVTGEAILQVINSAVVESVHSLRGFAASPEFEAKMDLAFGKNWDKEVMLIITGKLPTKMALSTLIKFELVMKFWFLVTIQREQM